MSEFSDGEQEVLFSVGSCFTIDQIWLEEDENRTFWHIELTEHYAQDKVEDLDRPFYIDMITVGFYLLVENDSFQLVRNYYQTLKNKANSPLWIISCQVGLGLIEYYQKHYIEATEIFEDALKTIEKENLRQTCQIIGNIFCILANLYRDMNNFYLALDYYHKAKKTKQINYSIVQNHRFWDMYIYKTELNSFISEDKYFYFCDRPLLNMVLLYQMTAQWNLAMDTFHRALDSYNQCNWNGEVQMFIKVLGYCEGNSDVNALMEKNRNFLGEKTLSKLSDKNRKEYVLYAYLELGDHFRKYFQLDHALLYSSYDYYL